jgi:hypothetical protein
LPNEEHVYGAVRDFVEETGLTLTVDDLTLLSGGVVRVPLHDDKYQLVYVYGASVHVPHVSANLRTLTKVDHVVISQSIVQQDSYCVVSTAIATDGLTMTLVATQMNYELLHFGFCAQWLPFVTRVIV